MDRTGQARKLHREGTVALCIALQAQDRETRFKMQNEDGSVGQMKRRDSFRISTCARQAYNDSLWSCGIRLEWDLDHNHQQYHWKSHLLWLCISLSSPLTRPFPLPSFLRSPSFLGPDFRSYSSLLGFMMSSHHTQSLLTTHQGSRRHAADIVQGYRKVCYSTMRKLASHVLMIFNDFVDVKGSDFRIMCGGRASEVHEIVLEEYEYFATMFKKPWKVGFIEHKLVKCSLTNCRRQSPRSTSATKV